MAPVLRSEDSRDAPGRELPEVSEIPGREKVETGCREIGDIASGQTTAIDARNCRDHAVGSGHRTALSRCGPHDLAIGKGSLFRQSEDACRKATTPIDKPFFQAKSALTGSYFFYTERNLGDCDRREREFGIMTSEPGNDRFIRLFPEGFGNDIRVQENQRSMPVFFFRPSLMTASRSMSSASLSAARRA